MKYRRKLSLLPQGTKAFKTYSELKDLYNLCKMEEDQWCEEHESCQECKNRDYQHNMTTLIYNGITDQACEMIMTSWVERTEQWKTW